MKKRSAGLTIFVSWATHEHRKIERRTAFTLPWNTHKKIFSYNKLQLTNTLEHTEESNIIKLQ